MKNKIVESRKLKVIQIILSYSLKGKKKSCLAGTAFGFKLFKKEDDEKCF